MNLKRLLSASFGHFGIDILNSSIPIILVFVSAPEFFNLSAGQIAFAAMMCTFTSALTQPIFGVVADRLRGRWLGALGLFWMIFFYALAPVFVTRYTNYPAFVACLAIAALGSGALHPAGMINATAAGGRFPTTATSIFFVLGQIGLALGPIVGGFILQNLGLRGLPLTALVMLPIVGLMVVYLREPLADEIHIAPKAATTSTPAASRPEVTNGVYFVIAFVLLIALRSTTQQSYTTLLPKHFDELGILPASIGLMMGTYGFAGAMGTLVGGFLGDRFNRRMVIFLALLIGAPTAYMMLFPNGWTYYAAAIATGLLLNIPHSIMLIMAQRLLPRSKGMIGGAVLGFMFAAGAFTAWIAGNFADSFGLQPVLSVVAFMPIGAGLCALLLPSTRGVSAPSTSVGEPSAAGATR